MHSASVFIDFIELVAPENSRREVFLLVKLDPALRAETVTEVKFTDRVVKQPKTWKPWLDFCRKNRLQELTITTRTEQLKKEVDGVSITFEPTALLAYRLGSLDDE